MPTPMFLGSRCALVALLGLAGCAVTSLAPPAPGAVDVPAQWSTGAVGSAVGDRWWAVFGDPLLTELVDAARRANGDVRSAQAALRRARALRDAAGAALKPTLDVSASAQRGRAAGAAATTSLFDAGFDAGWEPDVFGVNAHGLAAADADLRAQADTLAATRVSVAAEVAVAYLQLRGAQARSAIARDNLSAQRQTLQIAQWREQAGLGSSIEVAQARSAVGQTEATLPVLAASVAQFAHALAVLTGRTPAELVAQLDAPAALPAPPDGVALDIPARTLARRPDVRAAERALEAAGERVAAADAARRPTLQLRASLAWSALTLGSLGSTAAARSLLLGATQPLLDGGLRDAQLAAQQAAFDAAREAYRSQVLAALQEVEDALAAIAAARERVAALQGAVDAARLAALLAEERQKSGLVDFQVVLDTERNLLSVQDALASAQTEQAADHVRLVKALGGGWSPSDAEDAGS